MSRLPDVSGAELVKALRRAGFVVLRQKGSHVSLEKRHQTGHWRTVIPMHNEIARGTSHDTLKQTGLSREDLMALL
jgi:predicted RNA binding protein YcfA (HicA-like mRNA interferase family)